MRFWVWRWEVLREELELWEELVMYHSEMPYGRALLSASRAVCHYQVSFQGSFWFRDFSKMIGAVMAAILEFFF